MRALTPQLTRGPAGGGAVGLNAWLELILSEAEPRTERIERTRNAKDEHEHYCIENRRLATTTGRHRTRKYLVAKVGQACQKDEGANDAAEETSRPPFEHTRRGDTDAKATEHVRKPSLIWFGRCAMKKHDCAKETRH